MNTSSCRKLRRPSPSPGRMTTSGCPGRRPPISTDLGFVAPADLDALTGDSFYTEISGERLDLLDRDLIIFSQASYLSEGADTILNDLPPGFDLTERECTVLVLLVEGLNNTQIAGKLFVSPSTIKSHVSNILSKLGVVSRTEAAALALRHRLVN